MTLGEGRTDSQNILSDLHYTYILTMHCTINAGQYKCRSVELPLTASVRFIRRGLQKDLQMPPRN